MVTIMSYAASYRMLLLMLITCISLWRVAADNCTIDKYDFSALNGLPWIVEVRNGTTNVVVDYRISICSALSQPIESPCQHDAAVCRRTNHTDAVLLGHLSDRVISIDRATGALRLLLKGGATCPGDRTQTLQTQINFECGKTLGSPIFVDANECTTFFDWHTTAACVDSPPSHKEVKCYVYDRLGKKHDLSPLIKQHGAYQVKDDFYINVCREITPDGTSARCPAGAAACNLDADVGAPTTQLQITASGELYLQYVSLLAPPAGCSESSATSITFVCPRRGGSRDPVMTSSLNCRYEIEWQTEHACAEDYLTTDTCQFSTGQHGVQLDITPLTRPEASPYRVDAKSADGETYRYYMNVCGALSMPCPHTSVPSLAVCQVDADDGNKGFVLGKLQHHVLRYSDGELTMIYLHGDKCSNGFRRNTVIKFQCNKTIDVGEPTYSTDDNCTYMFDWQTRHACPQQLTASQCRLDAGDERFDLSPLIRYSGDNWEAVTADATTSSTTSRYFINVCNDVVVDNLTRSCPKGAAICVVTRESDSVQYRSLGRYLTVPEYSGRTRGIRLHYTDGDDCTQAGRKTESHILLKCKPGDLQSALVLLYQSQDGCSFEFEWQTSAACVLGQKTGTGCKVIDDTAGYSFDLSPLTRHGDKAYYLVYDNATHHEYFLNVCDKVTGTKCDNKPAEVATCQVDTHDDTIVYYTGQTNDTLHYYDGLITLVYSGGESYRSHFTRQTEIAFLCDRGAGAGRPVFHPPEADHTYSFIWRTRYACPRRPVECLLTDAKTNRQYDISSLSRSEQQENWVALDDAGGGSKKRKFYLNVCRRLNPVHVGGGCSTFAGICQTEFKDDHELVGSTNLGESLEPPSLDASGDLQLTFTGGSPCREAGNVTTMYSSTVRLQCERSALTSGPQYEGQVGNCHFLFVWKTAAACAVTETTAASDDEPCVVKDPNSQYVYNLQPLRRTGSAAVYEARDNRTAKTLKVNVCGTVADCQGAVCDGKKSLAEVSTRLSVSSEGVLSLTYFGKRLDDGSVPQSVITFECDRAVDINETRVVLARHDEAGATYWFSVSTVLACRPQPVECVAIGPDGVEYDLRPLARTADNWVTADTRPDHADLDYYINVCRPVNPVAGVHCPGGPVGTCQASRRNGATHNAGYIQGRPHVSADGTVSLRYVNGQRCHVNTSHDSHRTTRILFTCSDVEHGPIFENELPDCEYLFSWQTPVVCKVKKVIGENCAVVEPLYHATFDLSALRKAGASDWEVAVGGKSFLLNVCGSLRSGKGACEGAGACLQEAGGGPAVNIGDSNGRVSYRDGIVSLRYTHGTGRCLGAYRNATVIEFECDHRTAGVAAGPRYVSPISSCAHLFRWPTSLACLPFSHVDCRVRDAAGNTYDLSRLTRTADNYRVTAGVTRRTSYVLNVCTSLVHQRGVTCPPNTAACLIDETGTKGAKQYISIGELGEHVVSTERGHLNLKYSNGARCVTAQGVNNTWTTVIMLTCKHDAIDTEPSFLFTEDCQVYFSWVTSAACPVNRQVESPSTNCTVQNPQTGYTFDLNSLKKATGYKMDDRKGGSLLINVCAPLQNSACSSESGACVVDKSGGGRNVGVANGQLTFVDGLLALRYASSQPCGGSTGTATRSTVVNFVCGSEEGESAPAYVGSTDDCTYYVSWHTALACETQVKCSVEVGGTHVHLAPLIKRTGFYTALDATGATQAASYYVNVCRPLAAIHDTLCPPQAAICKQTPGQPPQSLGRVVKEPFVDATTGKVTMVYEHGEKCHDGFVTSKIVFICQHGPSLGVPSLEVRSADGCSYQFEWRTNAVCASSGPVTETNCSFTDLRTGHTFDFNALRKSHAADEPYQVITKKGRLSVSVCGHPEATGCEHASSCRQGTDGTRSYGAAGSEQFIREGDTIKMSYSGGARCASGDLASTYILFVCDDTVVGSGQPELFSDISDCVVVLKWRTGLACVPSPPICHVSQAGHTFDLSPLTRTSDSYSIVDEQGNKYWLNVCGGVHGGGAGCPPTAVACRQLPDGTVDILGLVRTQKIHVADDGETLVVEYTEGSTACSLRKRRSDNPPASVRIYFKCGSTLGVPVLQQRMENTGSCLFEFEWTTKVACAENSRNTEVPLSSARQKSHVGVAVGVSVAVCLLVAAILTYTVIKPERRQLLKYHASRLLRRLPKGSPVRYSKLLSSEDEFQGSSGSGYTSFDRNNIQASANDSDEDLLL